MAVAVLFQDRTSQQPPMAGGPEARAIGDGLPPAATALIPTLVVHGRPSDL
jgi:hypothetical protein